MALTFEKKENRHGPYMEITGYEGWVTFLKIPSEMSACTECVRNRTKSS